MLLTLSVKNHQSQTTRFPEEHHFGHTGGSIGRDSSNDWSLPDENNFLSKKHALIQFNESHFYIIDNSTNGIFINQSQTPLGRGNQHKIQASDEIIMGEYTLMVSQLDESVEEMPFPLHDSFASSNQTETSPFTLETTHDLHTADHDPFDDIFNPKQEEEPYRHVVDTTANSHNAFFFDETNKTAHETKNDSESENSDNNNNHNDTKNSNYELFLDPTTSSTKDNNKQAKTLRTLEIENINNANDRLELKTEEKPESTLVEKAQEEKSEKAAEKAQTIDTDALTQILLSAGLSVEDISRIQPTKETYQLIGQVLKESIDGTMNLLRSRTEAKNHLHLDNTLISPRENNPLKFLPNAHFVLKQTLSSNHSDDTYLTLADALNEAYDDISAHEYSMATSIQEALTATIKNHFAPTSLQRKLEKDRPISSRIPLKREANLWKLFTSIYDDIAEEASESFQILLDKEIVNAYEIQMKRLKEKRQKNTK